MRRGYSLPLVLLVLSTLSLAMLALSTVATSSARSTGAMLQRRQALYACDGVVRALSVKSRDYFATTSAPTAATLRQALCGNAAGPSCPDAAGWMPGFSIEDVAVDTGATNEIGEIANGPFSGQMARRTDLALRVELRHTTGRRCRVTQRMVNGQIGLFQFAVFSGIPMDLYNPPPMTISGRTHINGDFCAGGTNDLVMERVTVSGRLRSGCGGGSIPFVPAGSIATNGFRVIDRATNTATTIDSTTDSSRADWVTFAQARWNGNALDEAHAVPFLRLPVATAAEAQPGNNQDGAARTNVDTLRLLVDPPRGSDNADAAAERLYNKADIRIINGVWYRRDGTVLWSDHSGSVNALTEELALGVPPLVSAAPSGPKRFSYYERDASGKTIVDDGGARSVVSYGLLHRVSATDWRPGNVNGTTTELANTDEKRLLGTRTGFLDRRVGLQSGEAAARVLPLNFDVAAFVEALQSTDPGELGAIFGTSFNGIVWIGHTWPDHDRGFTTNAASGVFAATAPTRGIDGDGRHALPPLPLCHNGADATTLAGAQAQVDCNAEGSIPRVNAVRVHNAHAINPDVLPRGLTIVTNGPMYLLGDINTSSLVGTTPGTPRVADPAGPWVPVMMGGDAVTILSRNWTDRLAAKTDRAFGVAPSTYSNACSADAGPTTVVAAVLAGHVDTASTWGGGINNFPRFIECWANVDNRIIGSLVIGYRSVYQRQRYHFSSYRPPNRLWSFDVNFANPTHQPPGTPSFFVQAVERWDRD